MGMTCSKCGSSEIRSGVEIVAGVAGVDNFATPHVYALAYRKPEARVFRGPAPHRLLARICGACGFVELYLEDPGGFAALIKRDVDEV
jgi:hypothetical protein